MKQSIAALILLTFCPTAFAVTIGPGEVYQQTAQFQDTTGLDLQGGTIVGRADGNWTWFLSGDYKISSGVVNTRLRLDNSLTKTIISGGEFNDRVEIDRGFGSISGGDFNQQVRIDRSSATISGGMFNNDFEIDRVPDDGTLAITGGTFTNLVDISLYQGDVSIAGGDFQGGIRLTSSFSEDALPTLTFVGTDWQLNGQPLTFSGREADITGNEAGLLSGKLADGNLFSVQLNSLNQPSRMVVSLIPEPSTGVLALLSILGLSRVARRQKHVLKNVRLR